MFTLIPKQESLEWCTVINTLIGANKLMSPVVKDQRCDAFLYLKGKQCIKANSLPNGYIYISMHLHGDCKISVIAPPA
jgi:hypothetical protein